MITSSLLASEVVWDGSAQKSSMSQSAYDKLVKIYVNKMYPDKVKMFKEAKESTTILKELMWEDIRQSSKLSWRDAKLYCGNLRLAGFDNWYLPSKTELLELYENKNKLKNNDTNVYWSDTQDTSDTAYSWLVSFYTGYDIIDYKTFKFYVRCVRDEK